MSRAFWIRSLLTLLAAIGIAAGAESASPSVAGAAIASAQTADLSHAPRFIDKADARKPAHSGDGKVASSPVAVHPAAAVTHAEVASLHAAQIVLRSFLSAQARAPPPKF